MRGTKEIVSFADCSGVTAAAVTQHISELSLSCDEQGATASTAELTEPGRYQLCTALCRSTTRGAQQQPW